MRRQLIAATALALAAVLAAPAQAAPNPEYRGYCRIAQVGDRARIPMGTLECTREGTARPRWLFVDTPYTRRAALRTLLAWPVGEASMNALCRDYERRPGATTWGMVGMFGYYPAAVVRSAVGPFFARVC